MGSARATIGITEDSQRQSHCTDPHPLSSTPRDRGRRARIAASLLGPADSVLVAGRFLGDRGNQPGRKVDGLRRMAEDEAVGRICLDVVSRSEGRVGRADVLAALGSVTIRHALADVRVGRLYIDEMTAMLSTALAPSIRSCRLDMPKLSWDGQGGFDPENGPAGAGPARREIFDTVVLPLAYFALVSLSQLRLATEMLTSSRPRQHRDLPVGWAPGTDSIWRVLRYALLGQFTARRFLSKAFLDSAFSRFVQGEHMGRVVWFLSGRCPQCMTVAFDRRIACPQCGTDRVFRLGRRLLGVNYLSTCCIAHEGRHPYYFAVEASPRIPEPLARKS